MHVAVKDQVINYLVQPLKVTQYFIVCVTGLWCGIIEIEEPTNLLNWWENAFVETVVTNFSTQDVIDEGKKGGA